MKIQVLSDLHAEFIMRFRGIPSISPSADILVMAGDITNTPNRLRAILLDLRQKTSIPIIAVLGNHEFYGHNFQTADSKYKKACEGIPDFHLLRDSYVDIQDYRITGATLWTSYNYGNDIEWAIHAMNDFNHIKYHKYLSKTDFALKIVTRYSNSLRYIKKVLRETENKKTIIVTHHAPSTKSIHPNYINNLANYAFVNDLDDLIIETSPNLWIHGHVHNHFDYYIGSTRIVANPFGYDFEYKTSGYIDEMLVEV